jgi:hypothetical protein
MDLAGHTLFPQPEDIPQSLALAFMRMMMAHAVLELEVRTLQSSVANDPSFGEQPENQWNANKRPKCMVKLIKEKLGQIPETEAIRKLLRVALVPINQRNHLAHGTWWSFDRQTATISVRGGIQRKNKDQFADYTEKCILAIADALKTLSVELYKLRSDIENRRGDHDVDDLP